MRFRWVSLGLAVLLMIRFVIWDELFTDYLSSGKMKDWFERSGGWMVALSRCLPLLPEVIACLAGLASMPLRKFTVALACGAVPVGFVFAWIGHLGQDRPALAIGLSLAIPPVLWLLSLQLMRRKH